MQTIEPSTSLTTNRKKIALYYPYFSGGGAEAVGLWILEALKDRYDLTVFTLSQVKVAQLNKMYGTTLTDQSVKFEVIFPRLLQKPIDFSISNNKDIRKYLIHRLIRFFKSKQGHYDLVFSGYNATDLGRSGMQYIHWPRVIEGKDSKYHDVSNFSFDNLKANISLANSQKVATEVKSCYGLDTTVIYPPVVIKALDIPWEEKEDAFICSGRLVVAKQPHKVIQILREVREQGFDIKLYLTGGGGGIYGWRYERTLNKIAKENKDWVTICRGLSYDDYSKVLYKCKYGLHFKIEPFGISIAEMMRAGAIPFVRDEGGQVEIVGQQNTDLFFKNMDEAVKRVVAVLSSPEKQQQLRTSLEKQKELFSSEKFMEGIRNAVDTYFKEQG
ncbi:MAG: glycosyltransferase [Microcystaceae cyanobacterium]